MKFFSKVIPAVIITGLATVIWLISHHIINIPSPAGIIAQDERTIIIFAVSLMLAIVIPSVLFTFYTAWKFRESNTKAEYKPDEQAGVMTQILWWAIPSIVVAILMVVTWFATHALDPYRVLATGDKPLTVQVVSLQWKWLFIYPEEGIATINYLELPVNRQVTFELTADSPMNSFWIPQLAGQMYAMNSMVNQLHVLPTKIGTYTGSTAEISGAGFADMRFPTKVVAQSDFDKWVASVKKSPLPFTTAVYKKIYAPSEHVPVTLYGSIEQDMYKKIILQYSSPENALHK